VKNNLVKNIIAILAGFLFVIIITTLTDFILEKTGLMKQPFYTNPFWFIGFVVLYRCVYGVIGSYITARLAPVRPMRLVMIGGFIGLALSTIGAVVMWDTPPHWYAVAIIITALPCAWLGGKIFLQSVKSVTAKA
jgi:hypothetical protein